MRKFFLKIKRIFIIFFIATFLSHLLIPLYPAFALTSFSNIYFERGVEYFESGNYEDALREFRNILRIDPENRIAKRYITIIELELGLDLSFNSGEIPFSYWKKRSYRGTFKEQEQYFRGQKIIEEPFIAPSTITPPAKTAKEKISRALDLAEASLKEDILETKPYVRPIRGSVSPGVMVERVPLIEELVLDKEVIDNISMPIKIEQGKSVIISGNHITRFLVVSPNVIDVRRENSNEISVTGRDIGYSYLHIWDREDRWTLYFQGIFPRPKGLTLEEEMRLSEKKASNFKLRYSMDWVLFEQGRRLHSVERQSYSYSHWFTLTGETPYGDFAGDTQIKNADNNTDLSYLSLRLTRGNIGPFKDFTIKTFDYGLPFGNLAYGGATLRGIELESPAFNNQINYTTFWGREGGGRYGGLSPSLTKTEHSFLSGFDVNYIPSEKIDYGFTCIHGWGRDREDYLNKNSYDFDINYHFTDLDLGYEVSSDSESFAHLVDAVYDVSNLKLTAELRNIAEDFNSITGRGQRQGELGGLFTVYYKPTLDIDVFNRLDVYKDRLYPNPENENRWNIDYSTDLRYSINPTAYLRFDYGIQDERGKVSPRRFQSVGVTLNKTFDLLKKISTSIGYRNSNSKNFSSPGLDYINDKLSLGLRFNIIGELYYYLTKEINWITERYDGSSSTPHVLETGLNWDSQIFDTSFYSRMRLIYRDEEDAGSTLSFLSGEDYLEGYGEISYNPHPDMEVFLSGRLRNVWAENPAVDKRMEVELRTGLRYIFDTGWSWSSVGTVDGYAFKDLNSDGIKQIQEPGVEGIKLYIGKNRSEVSDSEGHYVFEKVKAKEVPVTIDSSSLPAGFVLTTSSTQEAVISHYETVQVDFGIISRSEIIGIVFVDLDGDGKFSKDDRGLSGVILMLEDGTHVTTDGSGRYFFRNVTTGANTITLNINSVPVDYLPQVPLGKKITLFEGMSFEHNIPLKNITE